MATPKSRAVDVESARAMKEQREEALQKATARAVAAVMGDDDLSLERAVKGHGVPETRLRAALRDAGWVPPRFRNRGAS